jgi:excisionase family DNA binding protein
VAPSFARAAAKSSNVLTLAETAAHLRVTEQDILRLVREQGLPGRKIGDGWRFLKAAVETWLATSTATDQAQFWQTHFGALRDDTQLAEIVREAYRKRGRPDDGAL